MSINKTKLENDLMVVTDDISGFESASLGIFVNVGSVDENADQSGISHFLEHMAFKGTTSRSAGQISKEIESVGGFINAYTSKEVTAFHTKVLKNDIKLAVDIITDIIQNSVFDEVEFDKERSVIIQEIRQLNDTPDDFVFDMFQSKCFDNESLGTQILGSESDILSFKPIDMMDYLKSKYSTKKMVLSASGGINHEELCDLASNFIGNLAPFETKDIEKQKYIGGFIYKKKPLEQTHLILGFEGLSHTNENKFDISVLSTILGGGMSSRLFQEIREKRGLVYSIFSFISNYRDTGTFGVYAACEHSKAHGVINIIRDELNKIRSDITSEELQKAKTQLKASVLMGLESSAVRMERMANQYLLQKGIKTIAEITEKIDRISVESITKVAENLLKSKPTLAAIGNGGDIENLYADL